MAMETRFTDHLTAPFGAILVPIIYSIGFIFVALGRSELSTEQTSLAGFRPWAPTLRGFAGRSRGIVYVPIFSERRFLWGWSF